MNFPNNPTGALPSRETFIGLVQMCDERGIRLFSDEVYRGLELDRATMLPQAAELSDISDLAERDVEVLRAAGPAHRLAGHA